MKLISSTHGTSVSPEGRNYPDSVGFRNRLRVAKVPPGYYALDWKMHLIIRVADCPDSPTLGILLYPMRAVENEHTVRPATISCSCYDSPSGEEWR